MAESGLQPSRSTGLDFIETASLTYFIPLATDFDPRSALKKGKNIAAALRSIECRDSLFFDESVDIYLALKASSAREDVLKSSLERLVVSVEAKILNSHAPDRDGPPASEVIYAGSVEAINSPVLVPSPDTREEYTLAIWKLAVFLSRPRMRLQGPSVVFTATASFKPTEVSMIGQLRDGYLPSGVASGLNLLESFASDPALGGIQPRLSALRVSRVAPLTQQARDLLQPIQATPKQLALRIYPTVHSRIRFARPGSTPPNHSMIAMLEIDFTPFFDCEISLTSITMTVHEGKVEDLTSQPAMALPMACVAHDHITFLYRIIPEDVDGLAKSPARDLNIAISMIALEQPGVCTPKLTMTWTTTVDFTLPVNPGFGSAMQPIQRAHRPSQLSINSITSMTAPAVARPDALPSLEADTNKTELAVPDLGVIVTFSAPPPSQRIFPGEIFAWSIFVVNRTAINSAAIARKLAFVAIPKRRRNESRINRPPSVSYTSTTAHGSSRYKSPPDRSIADAVLDDNIIHAMQRSSVVDSAEMVCLSADVRVGPLASGACHVAELRFMALKSGIVGLEAVRIIDLGSTEHVDIRDLPTVIVESPGVNEAPDARPVVPEQLVASSALVA